MCCGTEAGSYLRLMASCITQLKAQGPSRTCNASKEEDLGGGHGVDGGHEALLDHVLVVDAPGQVCEWV